MDPRDINDPERVLERRWGRAINYWLEEAYPDPLEALLRAADGEIPDFAREFLADLVAGKVKKGKGGRPQEYPPSVQRAIAYEYFAALETLSPSRARVEVAGRRGNMSASTVRNIVARIEADGITREVWIRMARPS